jgi:hypothetical protein
MPDQQWIEYVPDCAAAVASPDTLVQYSSEKLNKVAASYDVPAVLLAPQ